MKNILLCCLLLFNTFVIAKEIESAPKKEIAPFLQKNVAIFEDITDTLGIYSITTAEYQSQFRDVSHQEMLNFGLSEHWIWIRIQVSKPLYPHEYLLEIEETNTQFADLYFRNEKGHWFVQKNGYAVPKKDKYKEIHWHSYPLYFHHLEEVFYLRMKANGQPTPLYILSKEESESKNIKKSIIYGVFYGLMFFVFINNASLAILTASRAHLTYSVIVLFYIMQSIVANGFIKLFIDSYRFEYALTSTAFPVFILLGLYAKYFLSIKEGTLWDKILTVLVGLNAICFVLVFLLPPMPIFLIMQSMAMFTLTILVIASLVAIRNSGKRFHYYYLYALFGFAFFVFLQILHANTAYPPYFYMMHVEWGWLSEVLILAYALNKKLEHDKKRLQEANETARNENLRLMKEQNTILELKVEERTEEIRQQANALQQALSHNQAINNALNASALVSISDLRGEIVSVNHIFCEVSGYTENELLGKDHRIINSGYHPKSFWAEMWKTITQGNSWRSEVCNRAKDGSLYWVDNVINPILDENGKVYQYLSIRSLITERKKAEATIIQQNEELQASEEELKQNLEELQTTQESLLFQEQKFRHLFEGSNDAIMMLNPLGFIDCNEATLKIFDISKEDFISTHPGMLSPEYQPNGKLSKEYADEKIGEALQEGFARFEWLHKRYTGEYFDAEVLLSPFKSASGLIIQATVRDITERKAVELKIKEQKEALEQSLQALKRTQTQLIQAEKSAALGVVMATISHEINNPINSVKVGSGLLKENYLLLWEYIQKSQHLDKEELIKLYQKLDLDETKDDLDALTQEISIGAERVVEIVDVLRNFIRLDEQGIKKTDLSKSLHAVLIVLRNRFLGKIEIFTHFEDSLPEIYCNISRINQVFLAILLNASEAIENKGCIHIKTFQNNEYVGFSVADNGKGIAQEVLPHLFKSFVSGKGKETGMGLYVAQEIINEHKGKIEFETSLEGTIFNVFLPKEV